MVEKLRGMIVAKPGRIRECVQALLLSIPQVERVELIDDPDQALKLVVKQSSNFVLFGLSLPDIALQAFLRDLKENSPQTQSLVLVENIVQQQLAKVAGADEVLLQGASAEQFIAALERIVPSKFLREHLEECSESEGASEAPDLVETARRA